MKATIGSIKKFWERFKKENPNIQVSIPFVGGLSANIPLAEKGKIIATRKGIDANDKSTPFVQSDLNILMAFYSEYLSSKEYKFCRSPYAETIPLRKKDMGFSYGVNVDEFKIEVINAQFKPVDHIQEHFKKAQDLFKDIKKVRWNETDNTWENNNSVRISSWNLGNKTIAIQRATYFDQIGTNLTLDWASGCLGEDSSLTLRNDIEGHDKHLLPKLNSSILANTLGVAVDIINPKTKEILIPIRGSEQAIMANGKGQFHCSASGVFKWEKNIGSSQFLTFDFFMKGMEKEIENEIGLSNDQYDLIPLAFTRELVRGGKPQLFFIAETELDISKLKLEMKNAEESWEFINEEDIPSDSPLCEHLQSPTEAPQEMFTYEGWMALKVALAYMYQIEPPFPVCQ